METKSERIGLYGYQYAQSTDRSHQTPTLACRKTSEKDQETNRTHRFAECKKKERPKKNDKNLETEQTAPLLSERIDNNRAQEQTNSDADRNLNNRVANIKSNRVETSA
jgi:hypothetical protein